MLAYNICTHAHIRPLNKLLIVRKENGGHRPIADNRQRHQREKHPGHRQALLRHYLLSSQSFLPEAVRMPVSIQGLEVLAVIDTLATASTHRQLASCKGRRPSQELFLRVKSASGLAFSAHTLSLSTQGEYSLCQARR